MKRFFCILLVLCLLLPFCGCEKSYKKQIIAFDEAIEVSKDVHGDTKFSDLHASIDTLLDQAGFLTSTKQMKASEFDAFTNAYLETHSLEALFSNYERLSYYIHANTAARSDYGFNEHCSLSGSDKDVKCFCQLNTEFLNYLLEKYVDAKSIVVFDKSVQEKGTYYKNNPNVEPQPYTRTVSSTGHGSKTATGTVKYYGDFAILYEEIPHYDDGYIGWKNGVFIDKSGSWKTQHLVKVYYQGAMFAYDADISEENLFQALAASFQLFSIEGHCYVVSRETEDVDLGYNNGVAIEEVHTYLRLDEITP